MYDLEHKFEEIPLCIGPDKSGQRQQIALISGAALLSVSGPGRWEIVEVKLDGPVLGDHDVSIPINSQLWNMICESIEFSCGDRIWDETLDLCQPDPDAAYDRNRDERVFP